MFNIITGINESKTLIKHISCECKYKVNGRKCNSNQQWNNDKCRCECKRHNICEKNNFWNPATCSCESVRYLANIMDDLVIKCSKIIDVGAKSYDKETKAIPMYFNEKKQSAKHKISILYLHFH